MSNPIYNPALPADNSEIVAGELRDQFAGLSAAIDDAVTGCAVTPSGVDPLNLIVSNPPTQGEMQAIANKLDEMLASLKRC